MEQTEKDRLKEFMEANFSFDDLKQMKFWPKGTRRNDYEKQAARVCQFFGYETVYEYGRGLRMVYEGKDSGCVVGQFADTVDKEGQLKPGGGFLLHVGPPTVFTCPACTKEQDATEHAAFNKSPCHAKIRCKGCKRPLLVGVPMYGAGPMWLEELPTRAA